MSVAQNPLSIKVDLPRDDAVLLTIEGELDIDTATELQHHLANQLRHGRRHFLLDVSAVPFMDSSGMNIILRTYQEVRRIPGGVYVIAPTPPCGAYSISPASASPWPRWTAWTRRWPRWIPVRSPGIRTNPRRRNSRRRHADEQRHSVRSVGVRGTHDQQLSFDNYGREATE